MTAAADRWRLHLPRTAQKFREPGEVAANQIARVTHGGGPAPFVIHKSQNSIAKVRPRFDALRELNRSGVGSQNQHETHVLAAAASPGQKESNDQAHGNDGI